LRKREKERERERKKDSSPLLAAPVAASAPASPSSSLL